MRQFKIFFNWSKPMTAERAEDLRKNMYQKIQTSITYEKFCENHPMREVEWLKNEEEVKEFNAVADWTYIDENNEEWTGAELNEAIHNSSASYADMIGVYIIKR